MSWRLVLPDGRRVEVAGPLVLGRAEADISLDDEEVSRRHAAVRPAAGGLELEDLGSRNGTWVNGARIDAATRLAPGDEVRLGRTSVSVKGGHDAGETVVSPATPAPSPPPGPAAPFSPPPGRARRTVATRLLAPLALMYAAVGGTAIALVAYFAAR